MSTKRPEHRGAPATGRTLGRTAALWLALLPLAALILAPIWHLLTYAFLPPQLTQADVPRWLPRLTAWRPQP